MNKNTHNDVVTRDSGIRSLLPSILLIVAANLIPLVGVIGYGWSVFALLVLFWFENIVTGLFYVPRILMAKGHLQPNFRQIGEPVGKPIQVGIAAFFCIHYGLFCFGHGQFVFSMADDVGSVRYDIEDVFTVVNEFNLWWAILALVISHGFSFVYNYMSKGEYKKANFMEQMKRPYNRVVVLHLTIIFGSFLVSLMEEPLMGLIVLLAVKIVVDVKAHIFEHTGKKMPIMPLPRKRVSKLVSEIRQPGNKERED